MPGRLHAPLLLNPDGSRQDSAHPLPAITMKGISRPVVPYAVDGRIGEVGQRAQVISELGTGLDLFLDTAVIDDAGAEQARRALKDALAALDARGRPAKPPG